MKKQIVEAINAEKYEFVVGEGVMESAHNYAMDKAIDIINDLIPDDMVLVPKGRLEIIAASWDDTQPEATLSLRMYDASCMAKAMIKQGEE